MHSAIKAALTMAVALLALRAYMARTERLKQVDDVVATLASTSLESEADVERVISEAAHAERAILFIHVDWAFMEPQRTRFAQFARDYHAVHPNDDVLFYYVDCTPVTSGYRPFRALAGWEELEDSAGTSLIHGWGEVAWMQRGRVLHVERILNFERSSLLVKKTEQLLP